MIPVGVPIKVRKKENPGGSKGSYHQKVLRILSHNTKRNKVSLQDGQKLEKRGWTRKVYLGSKTPLCHKEGEPLCRGQLRRGKRATYLEEKVSVCRDKPTGPFSIARENLLHLPDGRELRTVTEEATF